VNWGSATQDHTYNYALKFSLDLVDIEEHVKNYRPQILLLSGSPSSRPILVDFVSCLTKGISLLTCANIVAEPLDTKTRLRIIRKSYKWLSKRRIRSFYTILEANDLEVGSKILLQSLKINLHQGLSFKIIYVICILDFSQALTLHVGVAILRAQRGFDFSDILKDECYLLEESMSSGIDLAVKDNQKVTPPETPDMNLSNGKPNFKESIKKEKNKKKTPIYLGIDGKEISKDLYKKVTIFQGKQKGTIDVWWLYDDGGLTVLLPYILSTRTQWSGCKLRLFALANREDELELEQRSMASLLSKFRISFNDTVIISDVNKKAGQEIQNEFERTIKKYRNIDDNHECRNIEGYTITDEELSANREKTNRHLRIRELLLKNSKDAALIVMTLPIPRKNAVSASLYMSWLEVLTKEMPPFLFIRGNQTSVLTFYS
ncbi:Bumetanide-sensitive sodium-(potassium)-chloride cotransporter, partial [Armadillidium vulgare]